MSNVDQRFGLKPVGHLLGLNWTDQVRTCYMTGASGAAYIGDAVDFAGSSDASGVYPTIAPATVGALNPIAGVIVGFQPDPTDLTILYRKNSTNRYAYVVFDPFVIYEIQASTDAVMLATYVGSNAVLIGTHSGDTATGLSGMELSTATTPTNDATYQLLILGKAPREDNDISSINSKWHVLISLHRLMPNYSNGAYFGARGV